MRNKTDLQRTPLSIRLLGPALLILLTLICGEIGSYLLGKFVLVPRNILYTAPEPDPSSFERYIQQRNATLGWVKLFGQNDFDQRGSRQNTFFPVTAPTCVSVYGDSFTYSEDVDAEHAWPNLLSQMLGCRVENFGVGGFGTDQAFLRFRGNVADEARTVLLVHQVENIVRNVNQYRPLLYAGTGMIYGFKPIFYLDNGQIQLEPPAQPGNMDEFQEIAARPEAHLRHEYFIPGGNSGRRSFSFPYSWNAAMVVRDGRILSRFKDVPFYVDFYRPDHPSSALQITVQIMQGLSDEAASRGQAGVIALLPNALEFVYRKNTGQWSYRPLVRLLEEHRIPFVDLGPPMLEAIGSRDPCSFTRDCNGHFTEEGYRMVAESMQEALQKSPQLRYSVSTRFEAAAEARRASDAVTVELDLP